MKCVKCGMEAAPEDRFCQECGGHLTPTHPVVVARPVESDTNGKSHIQLDRSTVNILLREFASKDGSQFSYQDGQFVLEQGPLKVSVTELPLKDTKLRVEGKFGTVRLELTDFQLNAEDLRLDLQVGMD